MDGIPDAEKLKVLASLLAPGLIILTLRSAVQSGVKPDLKDRILHYASISAIYYAVAFPLFNWKGGVLINQSLWNFLQYFLVPTVVGVLLAYESQGEWLFRIAARSKLFLAHPIPAAWDFAFSKLRRGTFILVTLNSGDEIAGLMGSTSFASSSREERDLLIERVWTIAEDGEWREMEPARSILLCGKDIRHVEIFQEAS